MEKNGKEVPTEEEEGKSKQEIEKTNNTNVVQ